MFSVVLATGSIPLNLDVVLFSWIADFVSAAPGARRWMQSRGAFSQQLIFDWPRAGPAIPSALRIAS